LLAKRDIEEGFGAREQNAEKTFQYGHPLPVWARVTSRVSTP
jgi:hypothetical protein